MEKERGSSGRYFRTRVDIYPSKSMRDVSFMVFDVQFKLISRLLSQGG